MNIFLIFSFNIFSEYPEHTFWLGNNDTYLEVCLLSTYLIFLTFYLQCNYDYNFIRK